MKRLLSFVLCLIPLFLLAQVQKVAILETVDKEGNISYAHKLMLRSNLAKAVTNAPGYEAYDRTDMDAIMGEQNFQRTGMVSNEQIKRLGEMTGAAYIMVAEAVIADEQNMFITAKILNVETAKTEATENILVPCIPSELQYGCETLAYKLLGLSTIGIRPPTPPKPYATTIPSNKPQTREMNPQTQIVTTNPVQADLRRTMSIPKTTSTQNAKESNNSEKTFEYPLAQTTDDPTIKEVQSPYAIEETKSQTEPLLNAKSNAEIELESEPDYASEETLSESNQNEEDVYAIDFEPAQKSKQKMEIVFRASKSFLDFSDIGGEQQIEVTSNEAWKVIETPSWVTTRQKSDALVVIVAQNEHFSDREGDIVLLNDQQMELRVVITQARNKDYLKLSAQLIDDTEGDGGGYTIKVSSNKDWRADTHADWCTIEQKGENLIVRLAANLSGENRATTIEVSASQSAIAKQVISVTQSPMNNNIIIHPTIITSSGESSFATITVITDMPEYRIEGLPNWCNIKQQNTNSFVIGIGDNSGGAAREAQILVTIDGGKSKTLTIRQQERLNYVSVSPKIITATSRGGIISVHVKGSSAWRVVNLPDWCQVTDQTDDSFTLSIGKNDTGVPRNASFSVSASGVREQIEVRQE